MLPDQDGISIVEELRKAPLTKRIPIILVTAKTTEIDKVKGLDSGADDYLTKPFGIMELISRVKALLRRTMNIEDDPVITAGIIELDNGKRTVSVEGNICELTYKEFELLNDSSVWIKVVPRQKEEQVLALP
ncbi:MAG: response regulator transcription factor [Lachnospiraceae bacterium]|nr:response regulator transcription factor [Lachnospiraceae bacterium]